MDSGAESTVQDLIPLAELAKELDDIGEPAFRIKYAHPFLLMLNDPMQGEVNTEACGGDTLTEYLVDQASYVEISHALPLRKSSEDTYTKRITVGRSKNNDIVLRSPKVSKLHTSFTPVDEVTTYRVTDMGSVNGTWVNKMRLHTNRPERLKSGDKVAFWRYEFEFMDLDPFIDLLRKNDKFS